MTHSHFKTLAPDRLSDTELVKTRNIKQVLENQQALSSTNTIPGNATTPLADPHSKSVDDSTTNPNTPPPNKFNPPQNAKTIPQRSPTQPINTKGEVLKPSPNTTSQNTLSQLQLPLPCTTSSTSRSPNSSTEKLLKPTHPVKEEASSESWSQRLLNIFSKGDTKTHHPKPLKICKAADSEEDKRRNGVCTPGDINDLAGMRGTYYRP